VVGIIATILFIKIRKINKIEFYINVNVNVEILFIILQVI